MPDPAAGFTKPRGVRFASDGRLLCVGEDQVVVFDFLSGSYLGSVAQLPGLHGQALVLWE